MLDPGYRTFDELYQQYFSRSTRFVKSYLHDTQAAEDVASECLIKLWEKMKSAELKEVQSYLFVALKNRALDHLKHESVRRTAARNISDRLKRELDIRIDTLESLDPQDVFSADVRRIIQEILDGLPEKTRAVFMMSRFEGRSHKEIAEHFGISVKGVDYQVSKALAALRLALRDYLLLFPFIFFHLS